MGKIVTIGSDPEFVLDDSSSLIEAYEFFDNLMADEVISPRICGVHCDRYGEYAWDTARIGCDGSMTTGEIRPAYSADPLKHYQSIQRCMNSLARIVVASKSRVYVRAGNCHYNEPLGGHIHIGGKRASAARVHALDTFLSFWLVRIYDKRRARDRSDLGYGDMGEYRIKSYGFEYRTPGSWLVNPQITKAVLCLAKVIGQEPIKLIREHINKMGTEERPSRIYNELQTFHLFPEYARQIQPLIQQSTRRRQWDEKADVLSAWGCK